MNIEKLKELVEKFYDYTINISICEPELFEKYQDKLSNNEINFLNQYNKLSDEIDKMIKADILYDFIFNQDGIKEQIDNDTYSYDKDSYEFREIRVMYKEIQEVFPNFKIKRLEEVE